MPRGICLRRGTKASPWRISAREVVELKTGRLNNVVTRLGVEPRSPGLRVPSGENSPETDQAG